MKKEETMKRRFLALIMSAAMAVTLLPAFSVKAEESSVTGNSGAESDGRI